jgi:outer membrane cobalamin receptor
VNGAIETDSKSSINVSVQNILDVLGAPGPVLNAGDASSARQNDRDVSAMLRYRDTHFAGIEFGLNGGFHYSLERYSSPGYDTYYKNKYFNLDPTFQIAVAASDRIIVGAELAQGGLESYDFGGRVTRRQASVYVSNEFVTETDRPLFDRLSLYQTLRYDNFSDVGEALTPKLGMNLRLVKSGDIRLRASYGASYRVPSFNDLYYPGFSNPLLRPEHSRSVDVGLLAGGSYVGEHSAEITYFAVTTTDRILLDPVTYIPMNIGKTISQGIESVYKGRFFDGVLEVGLNYTYTDARKRNSSSPTDSTFDKQLIFIPRSLFKGSLTVHAKEFTFTVFRVFTGERFTNEDDSRSVPAYSLTNANVRAEIPFGLWKLALTGEANNILDVDYQWFPGYPMPGRTYKVSLGIEY